MPLESTSPCNLCGSRTVRLISDQGRSGEPLRTVLCENCGLGWVDPLPSTEELREYYLREYRFDLKGTFIPKPKHVHRAARLAAERARRLVCYVPPGSRVLDFGAGGGEAVYVLRRLGFEAQGIEPHAGYAAFAREELGMPVESLFFQDFHNDDEQLDSVTMFHVLEHLDDPTGALCTIRRWLRPGGRLIVEVPDLLTPCQFRQTRFFPAHLHHFSDLTLAALAEKSGYAIIDRYSIGADRHLAMVLEKRRPAYRSQVGLATHDHSQQVAGFLASHSNLRHLLSSHPYVRPGRKLLERMDELLAVRHGRSARDIVESVIESALSDLVPSGSIPYTQAA